MLASTPRGMLYPFAMSLCSFCRFPETLVSPLFGKCIQHMHMPTMHNSATDVILSDELASCLINDLPFPVGQSILGCILGDKVRRAPVIKPDTTSELIRQTRKPESALTTSLVGHWRVAKDFHWLHPRL
jgi:hypothetical protein